MRLTTSDYGISVGKAEMGFQILGAHSPALFHAELIDISLWPRRVLIGCCVGSCLFPSSPVSGWMHRRSTIQRGLEILQECLEASDDVTPVNQAKIVRYTHHLGPSV